AGDVGEDEGHGAAVEIQEPRVLPQLLDDLRRDAARELFLYELPLLARLPVAEAVAGPGWGYQPKRWRGQVDHHPEKKKKRETSPQEGGDDSRRDADPHQHREIRAAEQPTNRRQSQCDEEIALPADQVRRAAIQ